MEQTSNFKLNKPEYTDVADIADLNDNTDIIDANLGKVTQPSYTDKNSVKYADILTATICPHQIRLKQMRTILVHHRMLPLF